MEEKSFFIETHGCTSNKADSNIISNVLMRAGYEKTSIENARFIIINTCAVKEQTENKIKHRLKELHELSMLNPQKHVIIAGCLPHITPKYVEVIRKIIPNYSAIIDLDNLNEIPEIFEEIKKGRKNLIFKTNKSMDKSEVLIDHPLGKITGIIPISEGCLGACTYCCVKHARGRLFCYNSQLIVKNVKYQLKQGIKQVYLTSQDCSTYGHEGTRLVDLMKDIVNLDFEFFLRMGMINPSFLINNSDQLLDIFSMEKVYQFLHVPIQSGSNRILDLMKRQYRISDIMEPIDTLRKRFPFLTISTDIICGFPGETENDFLRTVNFIKWLKPEILNISKFTARPGTIAKKMKQLNSKTIKERSTRLSKVYRNSLLNMNEKWEGWTGKILPLHEGKEKDQAFGRNQGYKNVFINNFKGKYGEFVDVTVLKIEGFNLYSKLV